MPIAAFIVIYSLPACNSSLVSQTLEPPSNPFIIKSLLMSNGLSRHAKKRARIPRHHVTCVHPTSYGTGIKHSPFDFGKSMSHAKYPKKITYLSWLRLCLAAAICSGDSSSYCTVFTFRIISATMVRWPGIGQMRMMVSVIRSC